MILNFFILLFCRASDLISTWVVTPDLSCELNPLVRKLGWKWNIYLNFLACIAGAVIGGWPMYVIIAVSLIVALWNFWIAWKLLR